MNIRFTSQAFEKLCNANKEMVRKLGPVRAKLLRKRLDQLAAAPNLGMFQNQPALGRCHELSADRSGQLSLDLDGPYRLIIEPGHSPVPTKPDGGLHWSGVTDVVIVEIEDTHD